MSPPDAGGHAVFSVVMATGIVSVAAADDGRRWLSVALFAVACALFVVLGIAAARRHAVTIESFATVAAASVIGVRFAAAGAHVPAGVFAALAAGGWAAVLVRLRGLGARTGTRLLAVVATEAVAISALAASHALAPFALAWFALGLVIYAVLIATLPLTELRDGRGDVWIAMGALAISALAAADLGAARNSSFLDAVAVVLWAAASVWGLVLVYSEARWPRLRYESRRWATVFPLGMYATASHAVGHVSGAGALGAVSHVMVWVALGAWALASAGAVRGLLRRRRRENGPVSRAVPI